MHRAIRSPTPVAAPLRSRASSRFAGLLSTALLALVLLTGCDAGTPTSGDPPAPTEPVGVVVNSIEVTLTVFQVEDPDAPSRTVELGVSDGTPVGASVRGELALVPMGVVPTAAVVDLAAGTVLRTIPLPEGSGATGSIFLTDSTALVANPGRGSVSPVNVRSGEAGAEVEVGAYPSAFVATDELVVVVNSELEDFVPARDGTLTVLDAGTLAEVGRVELSGENPGSAVMGSDGFLYVLNAGRWGEGSGSLSVVDLESMEEVAHHEGFGDLPGSLTWASGGRLHASSWSFGILVWDPATGAFVHPPEDAVHPRGTPSAAGLGVDEEGRLYALSPDCEEPGEVWRLDPSYEVEWSLPVGVCPQAVVFTELDEAEP